MTDKTQSQTYNFLSENKSIEDIKKQQNTTFKEKSRHGGVTYKLIEINNTNNQSVEWQPFLGLFFGRHLFLITNWS